MIPKVLVEISESVTFTELCNVRAVFVLQIGPIACSTYVYLSFSYDLVDLHTASTMLC